MAVALDTGTLMRNKTDAGVGVGGDKGLCLIPCMDTASLDCISGPQ